VRYWGDGGQIDAFVMKNVLPLCDSDVALRCLEVEIAQMFRGLYDLFSGGASAPGNPEGDDFVDGCFDSDSEASDLTALGPRQQSVEKTPEGVSCIDVTDLSYMNRLMRCRNRSWRCFS
jgi:hypothetical protein